MKNAALWMSEDALIIEPLSMPDARLVASSCGGRGKENVSEGENGRTEKGEGKSCPNGDPSAVAAAPGSARYCDVCEGGRLLPEDESELKLVRSGAARTVGLGIDSTVRETGGTVMEPLMLLGHTWDIWSLGGGAKSKSMGGGTGVIICPRSIFVAKLLRADLVPAPPSLNSSLAIPAPYAPAANQFRRRRTRAAMARRLQQQKRSTRRRSAAMSEMATMMPVDNP